MSWMKLGNNLPHATPRESTSSGSKCKYLLPLSVFAFAIICLGVGYHLMHTPDTTQLKFTAQQLHDTYDDGVTLVTVGYIFGSPTLVIIGFMMMLTGRRR